MSVSEGSMRVGDSMEARDVPCPVWRHAKWVEGTWTMISVADALDRIVVPAVAEVFRDGEVSAIAVRSDPDLEGG
jgi:hypothetical protein